MDGTKTKSEWTFVLRFRLPEGHDDPASFLDPLFEAGCDDATVGVGKRGSIALDFSRRAETAAEAIRSAIQDVQQAIPGASLVEVAPDLVNLADLAEDLGCSRQNLRKYASGEIKTLNVPFPDPVHTGTPSLWRLAEALEWFERNADRRPDPNLRQLAQATASLNLEIQGTKLRQINDATAPAS